ncbi:hypothetical protein ACFVYP_35875 [Kitasatospora sp. NPDC058201]|uniref:hypothetical protein n=1 Tax=unclassified Kitasatospora TaxID=2633591 RepID=UPI0036631F6F
MVPERERTPEDAEPGTESAPHRAAAPADNTDADSTDADSTDAVGTARSADVAAGTDTAAPAVELLRAVRAHPGRLPELLAVFAVRHRGPRAARRTAALRASRPDETTGELAVRAVTHARRVSQSEGAFVGGPFLWLVPFAFCSALLAQGQLLLELAALAGKDPVAPARAAEILVLQGAYPDLAAAERALASGPDPVPGGAPAGRDRRTRRIRGFASLIRRMARLLGLTSEGEDPPPSRWRSAGGWALLAVVFLLGTVAPLVWLPYMGASYNRATDRIATRAVGFHFGGAPAGWSGPRRTRTDPGMVVAAARAVASLAVPLGAVVVLLLADVRLFESRWPALAFVVIGLSALVGTFWYVARRRERDHRDRGEP